MRLTTLFGYITTIAAAAYVVAVCTEDEDNPVLLFERDDPIEADWVVIDAEFVEDNV